MSSQDDQRRDRARASIRDLVEDAVAGGDPSGWFEPLYASAEGDADGVPWAGLRPDPQLVGLLDARVVPGTQGRACVVGCGLGDDAEEVASRGFVTTAFDVAPSAVAWAQQRWSGSEVRYEVASLFALDPAWVGAFDLVAEVRTLQSLPAGPDRDRATAAVASLVAPGGRLLLVAQGAPSGERLPGPPWPLTPDDLDVLTAAGLTEDTAPSPDVEGAGDVVRCGPIARWARTFTRT